MAALVGPRFFAVRCCLKAFGGTERFQRHADRSVVSVDEADPSAARLAVPRADRKACSIVHAVVMRLFSVEAIIEAEDEKDAEDRAICPHPGNVDHKCPRGWMTMSHELDEEEAASGENLTA